MSYRTEKLKAEKKMRRVKTAVACVAVAAMLGLCVFSAFCPPDTWKYNVKKPKVSACEEGQLRMHFLNVGQGDSALIEFPDGKVALIDGGDGSNASAERVLRYMNALKIDTVDYLIVSHADADHCGALDEVVRMKKILNAYLPAVNATKAGAEYAELYRELMEEDCVCSYASRGVDLGGEDYAFTFVYPYSADTSEEAVEKNTAADDNALSSVLWLDYKGVSALFTGDAPLATEEKLLRDDRLGLLTPLGVKLSETEILKVSHHGSADSTSLAFLEYLQAETAILSYGKNNLYGHPSQEVCENLERADVTAYSTEGCGAVVITIEPSGKYTVDFVE